MADGGTPENGTPGEQHPLARVFLRAAHEGKLESVKEMLEDGVPVDVMHPTGLQAIHFAARNGNVELARELLARGANINAITLKGNSPLHVAALMGRTQVLKLLLQKGAEVNTQSQCSGDNFTPLYMAAQIGHQEIVTLLLAHGADPAIPTNNQCRARDVAAQQGHRAVAELLDAYERRQQDPSTPSALSSPDDSPTDGTPDPQLPKPPRWKHKPPMYTDVIPSPRHSPQRTLPPGAFKATTPSSKNKSITTPATNGSTTPTSNGECVK